MAIPPVSTCRGLKRFHQAQCQLAWFQAPSANRPALSGGGALAECLCSRNSHAPASLAARNCREGLESAARTGWIRAKLRGASLVSFAASRRQSS
eukprot:414994-Rhodomonas_salina.1